MKNSFEITAGGSHLRTFSNRNRAYEYGAAVQLESDPSIGEVELHRVKTDEFAGTETRTLIIAFGTPSAVKCFAKAYSSEQQLDAGIERMREVAGGCDVIDYHFDTLTEQHVLTAELESRRAIVQALKLGMSPA